MTKNNKIIGFLEQKRLEWFYNSNTRLNSKRLGLNLTILYHLFIVHIYGEENTTTYSIINYLIIS